MKVIVVGIDGGTWNLLKPWADCGKLPTIKYLIENGCWGLLESTIPPITGPAWISFATGKTPGRHGIFDFIIPKESLANMAPVSPHDVTSKTLPEYIRKSIIINLPASTPPKKIEDNIFLADFLIKSGEYIYPENLVKKYPKLREYRITPDESLKTDPVEYAKDIREVEKIRFECAKELFLNEDWNFFFILFSGTDWIQHIYYDKLLNQDNINDDIIRIYLDIDKYINWFIKNIKKIDDDWIIIVMSDHGFKVFRKFFRINNWLNIYGYVKFKFGSEKGVAWAKSREEDLKCFRRIAVPKSLVKLVRSILPVNIQRTLIDILKKYLKIDIRTSVKIDYQHSIAVCPISIMTNFGYIYINDMRFKHGVIDIGEKDRIVNDIILKLSTENFVRRVLRTTDVYNVGKTKYPIPDIIFELKSEYGVNPKSATGEIVDDILVNPSSHDLHGILIVYGKGIKNGYKLEGARIYDLAPTILHIFGLPIPNDMDGKVLMNIFKPDSELARRKPVYVDPSYYEKDEKETIRAKIRELKLKGKI